MIHGSSFKPLDTTQKKTSNVAMAKDPKGYNVLTEAFVVELCAANGQYENPKLNDSLFLHYKGFKKIQNLEKYTNLKALWLECNGILKIEGLETFTNLRSIYLHQNQIQKIENMNHLTNLCTLNLSNNILKSAAGLKGLVNLKHIDLAYNQIPCTEELADLLELPKLASLDLKKNELSDHENFTSFFGKMQQLNALYLQGNPGTRNVTQYRRTMAVALPNLTYLEDRPIHEYERLFFDAWKKGGKEGEEQAREAYKVEKEQTRRDLQAFARKNQAEGIKKRKWVLDKMMGELRGKRDDLIEKRAQLKEKYDGMSDMDQMKPATLLKIR